MEQLDFVESPLFQWHVLVDTDTVSLVLGIHKDHHSDCLDCFVNQHVAELKGRVKHGGIIGKEGISPSKFELPILIADCTDHSPPVPIRMAWAHKLFYLSLPISRIAISGRQKKRNLFH